jgi:hypothetical protein
MGVILWTRPVSANRNFVPDWTFQNSSLGEFRTLGDADWHAENGEIVGVPHSAAGAQSKLAGLLKAGSK